MLVFDKRTHKNVCFLCFFLIFGDALQHAGKMWVDDIQAECRCIARELSKARKSCLISHWDIPQGKLGQETIHD